MSSTEFDHLWKARENWKWGLFYYCLEDPRVIVPKRPKWAGRTLNFAYKRSYVLLVATLVLSVAPVMVGARLKCVESPLWIIAYILIILGIVIFYYTTELKVRKNQ